MDKLMVCHQDGARPLSEHPPDILYSGYKDLESNETKKKTSYLPAQDLLQNSIWLLNPDLWMEFSI